MGPQEEVPRVRNDLHAHPRRDGGGLAIHVGEDQGSPVLQVKPWPLHEKAPDTGYDAETMVAELHRQGQGGIRDVPDATGDGVRHRRHHSSLYTAVGLDRDKGFWRSEGFIDAS